MRRDIALRREAEEARRTMEREVSAAREREMLEQAERLSALGLLATGVAHEVNKPLQGMLSHLQAVRRALPADFRRTESLDAVERGIESIAGIVQRLLWLGAGQEDDRPASRLTDAVAFVRELLEPGLRRRGIRLELKLAATHRSVAIPSRELVQVLLNLVLGDVVDGVDVFRQARRINPDLKVILMGGFAETDRIAEARDLGVHDYLRKPLNRETLARALGCAPQDTPVADG